MKKIKTFVLLLSLTSYLHAAHLVTLLDNVYEAQQYWQKVAVTNRAYFWKTPLIAFKNIFQNDDWHKIIKQHQTALKKQEKELIDLLAEYAQGKKADALPSDNLTLKHKKFLKTHKAPSHFMRNWTTYAGTFITCATLGMYLSYFHNNHTLFVLDPTAPSLLSALQNNAPFLGHDYVNYHGQQYLQVTKQQEALAREFLERRSIAFLKEAPDKRLSFYNEHGVNRLWEFIDLHGLQPMREIVKILRNEAPLKLPGNATDPQVNHQMLTERLTAFLQTASENVTIAPVVQEYLRGRPLAELSDSEKNTLFTRIFIFLPGHGSRQLVSIFSAFRAVIDESSLDGPLPDISRFKKANEVGAGIIMAKTLVERLAHITDENSGIIALAIQMFTLRIQQRELQLGAGIHLVHQHIEQMRLNLELSAMIPLALTAYCGYKGIRFLYETIAHKSFKLIKKDLISLQLLLNKNRYKNFQDAALETEYAGLSYYWIARLLRHSATVSCPQQQVYKNYLEQLQNNALCPEQKLMIIECMFKDIDFLR